MSRDRLEFEGTVVFSNKGIFQVQLSDMEDTIIKCSISGKIRKNSVKILEGDKVKVEVSPFDTTQGRIIYRFKNDK